MLYYRLTSSTVGIWMVIKSNLLSLCKCVSIWTTQSSIMKKPSCKAHFLEFNSFLWIFSWIYSKVPIFLHKLYTPGIGRHPRLCFAIAEFKGDIISLPHYFVFCLVLYSKIIISSVFQANRIFTFVLPECLCFWIRSNILERKKRGWYLYMTGYSLGNRK